MKNKEKLFNSVIKTQKYIKGDVIMYSVTSRIKMIKQPYGGYVKPKDMKVIELNDDINLYEKENIHAILIGLTVDYLSRFSFGTPLKKAFHISLRGASLVNELDYAKGLLNGIIGIDDKSIEKACQLVGYDVAFRAGIAAYKSVKSIKPDKSTISNIKSMLNRCETFNEKYGPIVKDGFTFEGGYTDIISIGDGDFLTKDVLWDFKVSKTNPQSNHTLQLLIYYLMGQKSVHNEFKSIDKIGIFNPRLNKIYLKDIKDISPEVISKVSKNVIGY